jgi:transposase
MPVALRSDFDALQLRTIARKTKDGPQARRLLALASIYGGATRTEAAKIGGVTLQIVRDWVMKFNAHGPNGLIDKKAPGQPSKLEDTHRAALAKIIDEGPIPAIHGVVRWRLIVSGFLWNFALLCRRRRSAGNCTRWAFASSRPVHAIMRRPMARSRILKKFPRAPGGHRAGEKHRSRQHRNLVCRRGAHRPEKQDHPPLGKARHPTLGADRSTDGLDLYLWRRLPKRRQGRGAGIARLQH